MSDTDGLEEGSSCSGSICLTVSLVALLCVTTAVLCSNLSVSWSSSPAPRQAAVSLFPLASATSEPLALASCWAAQRLVAVLAAARVQLQQTASSPSDPHCANCSCVYYSGRVDQCPMPAVCVEAVTRMHVAITACGQHVRQDAVPAIKSWLLHRADGLKLHFWLLLHDSPEQPIAAQRAWFLQVVRHWPQEETRSDRFELSFVDVNSSLPLHLHGQITKFFLCGLMRLYLHHLLPALDAVGCMWTRTRWPWRTCGGCGQSSSATASRRCWAWPGRSTGRTSPAAGTRTGWATASPGRGPEASTPASCCST